MAYKKKPEKSKVFRKKDTLRNDNKVNVTKSSEASIADRKMTNYMIELEQLAIDKYNNCDIYSIDPYFNNLTLTGDNIIIRIFKENFIRGVDNPDSEMPTYHAYYSTIDSRERFDDDPVYERTPFPYIEKGVIVSISPEVQTNLYKQKEELAKFDKEAAEKIQVPKVGDVIEISSNYNSVWYKQKRYYKDKQEARLDLIKSPTEKQLYMFEHYYRFESYDMVGIDSSSIKKGFIEGSEEPEWFKKEKEFYAEKLQDLDDKISDHIPVYEQAKKAAQ